jgi:putative transposase
MAYTELLIEANAKSGVEVWAYCLMPNHVHLVAVPRKENGLAKAIGLAHHRYARRTNAIHGWQGHLWQERFYSVVMDEQHLLATVRYVELNPVRAGFCASAENWRWSSVHAHLHDATDELVYVTPMRELVSDWRRFLADANGIDNDTLRKYTRTGYPAGNQSFIHTMEELTGRQLRKRKRGRKRGQ